MSYTKAQSNNQHTAHRDVEVSPQQDVAQSRQNRLGNSFIQSLMADAGLSSAEGEQLNTVLSDPAQGPALLQLAGLEPSADDLKVLGELEEADVTPDEVQQLSEQAVSADPAGLEMLSMFDSLGVPLNELSAPSVPQGSATMPHRGLLEQAFGEDLSGIGVSLGDKGPMGGLMAEAATDGENISFASHSPAPDVVAEEVAHVLQGRRNGQGNQAVSAPSQSGEREADAVASQAARGMPVTVRQPNPAQISRKAWYSHVGDFFVGVKDAAVDTVKGLGSMAQGAWNLTAGWLYKPEESKKTWNNLKETVSTVVNDPGKLWDAVTAPIVKDWNEGRPGAAIGRVFFEVASLLVGTKGIDKLAKGSKVAKAADLASDAGKAGDKLSDAGKVGDKLADVGSVGDKTADASKVGDKTADASKVGDKTADASKADDAGKTGSKADDASKQVDDPTVKKYPDKPGDPAYSRSGPGHTSHPDEYAAMMSELEKQGVKITNRPGALGYQPNVKGKPGEFLLDPDASWSALRHEYQHYLDDAARGFPGKEVLYQPNTRWAMEKSAYAKEISLARRNGDVALIKELEALRLQEWQKIYKPELFHK